MKDPIVKGIKYLLFLMIFTPSCKTQNKGLFEFDPRYLEENEIALSEIADEITYIPLDNSFPIGLINSNIKFINKSIYISVLDIGILEFNKSGEFLRKVGSIGRGPGEYAFSYDFAVDDKKGIVYVHDSGDKIKVFSSTGDFIRSISLTEYGDNIETIDTHESKLFIFKLLQMGDSKYNWIVLDTLGNIIKKKERTIPMFRNGFGGSRGTYKFENKLFYWNGYCDTVFTILPDLSYQASFIISPGEHRVPMSVFNPFTQFKQFMHIGQIFETSHFWAIRYIYIKSAFVLIDKKNGKSFLTYLESVGENNGLTFIGGIENDLDGGPRFLPQSYFSEKGHEYMVSLSYPYQLKAKVKSNEFKNSAPKFPKKKIELEELANSLKETDNPVLMLVRLKN